MNQIQVTTEYKVPKLSKESVGALEELGLVLKTIYLRLKQEGYIMVDGRIVHENEKI